MASFTRAEIRSILGDAHNDDIENKLIALHLGVVDPLKDSLQRYRADAEKLPGVQQELDAIKADGGYKEKYEAEKKAHDDYKASVAATELDGKRRKALLKTIRDGGVTREEFQQVILKAWDLSKVELDDADNAKDPEAIKSVINTEYAWAVATPGTPPAPPANPPSVGNPTDLGKLDMAAYIAARKKK